MAVAEKEIKKKIAFEDYLLMPEIKLRYEIIDGEMIMSPAPTFDHQWIIQNIVYALGPFVRKKKLGAVVAAPCDILVRRAPLRTHQPDVFYVSFDRSRKTIAELRKMQVLELAPDLVVEILSPSDRRSVLKAKLDDYIKIGVRECWVVSPQGETVEVLRLSSGEATSINTFHVSNTLRSEVLPGFKMKVSEVFSDY
jgi:Uma2 family endonuclease